MHQSHSDQSLLKLYHLLVLAWGGTPIRPAVVEDVICTLRKPRHQDAVVEKGLTRDTQALAMLAPLLCGQSYEGNEQTQSLSLAAQQVNTVPKEGRIVDAQRGQARCSNIGQVRFVT